MTSRAILFACLLIASRRADAQPPLEPAAEVSACGRLDDNLSADLTGWKTKTDLPAAAGRSGVARAVSMPGITQCHSVGLIVSPIDRAWTADIVAFLQSLPDLGFVKDKLLSLPPSCGA